MHSERITVSMPGDVARELRQVVQSGAAASASAYVADAVAAQLQRDRWRGQLRDLVGEIPAEATAWAEGVVASARAARGR